MSYSVLIIGLGKIGFSYDLNLDTKFVYSHARAFAHHQKFILVGGVDSDKSIGATFSNIYGCPAYTNLPTALQIHKPDILVIAVPTSLHSSILKEALECYKPKAILCEKPISYDLKEAEYIVNTCAANNIDLYVNYMRISDPGVIEIKRRITTGCMGNNFKGVAWYSKGFFHNGSHFFNLLEYWLGTMKNSVLLHCNKYWNNIDPEPDLQVEFEQGKVVFLSASEEAFSHYTIELLTDMGRLRYERAGKLIKWQKTTPDPILNNYTVLSTTVEKIYSGMERYQWYVVDQLANAIEGKENNLCTGTAALETLKNMHKVFE